MGKRKRISAEKIKEARREQCSARLMNVPSSPRKMRLVADMVRGQEAFKALGLLHFSNKQAAADVEKLLKSAISNWEQKNGKKAEDGPQGRGYRIRKRSNHVTIYLDTINQKDA